MSFPFIIVGAGGHARVLIDTLLIQSATILGIVDPKGSGAAIRGIPVIGDDDAVLVHSPEEIRLVNGLGSIGATTRRSVLFEKFKGRGYSFASIIHQSSVIASDVRMSEGVQIMAGAVIQAGSCIGHNAIINTRASVDHDCTIGPHVHLAPGVTISGGVKVGSGVHIGTGAIVIQGVEIGKNSIIGAGTLVLSNVREGTTVVGTPAREVRG